jgi:pimeloyl-ACP methyl ester carboxylesterase
MGATRLPPLAGLVAAGLAAVCAYRYADMANDTADLLDRLGVTNADVVRWSDGGNIGLLLAVRRPDLPPPK